MKRGEVWRVRIPLSSGHKQSGEHPAILVQDDSFIASLPTILVIPFTSTAASARFPGTLLVQPDAQNGLTVASVALVFQLSAVVKRDCLRRLGFVDAPTLNQLFKLLNQLTGR
jgi:mRNA-degrading endonuclease toxin of MazEF toxin-antitoxin module